jgi:exosortase D (VPLPA-CTERM-specific)
MTQLEGTRPQSFDSFFATERRFGLFWLGVCLVGMGIFFWGGILRILDSWTRPEYSFGPIVPFVSAYMLLYELRMRPPTADGGSRLPGLLIVLLGIALGFAGNFAHVPHLSAYGLFIVVGGLALIIAGARQGLDYWPGWVHLLFMIPLPGFFYVTVSTSLQLISSKIGVEIVRAAGIPVYLTGNIIDLGVYQLQVAEACSGLRYLFPLMSFGYLFAVLFRGPLWQKLTLFFLSIPITVLMNSIRIGIIGILVNEYGISQAEGFLHWFEGWVIFISCTVLLYIAGLILQRMRAKPDHPLNILDLDFDGLFTPLRWLPSMKASAALVAAALLLVLSSIVWQLSPSRSAVAVDRQSFQEFPMALGEWQGRRSFLSERFEEILAANDYFQADFAASGQAAEVNAFSAYYDSILGGFVIHSPEVCLPGAGWEFTSLKHVEVAPGGGIAPFTLNRAVIQNGRERLLLYYWYEQQGRRFAGEYESKWDAAWRAVTTGRSDAALVRLYTPILENESDQAADLRLQTFMRSFVPKLPSYLPD